MKTSSETLCVQIRDIRQTIETLEILAESKYLCIERERLRDHIIKDHNIPDTVVLVTLVQIRFADLHSNLRIYMYLHRVFYARLPFPM